MEWTTEQKQRVAAAIIARRDELNITQAQAVERADGGVSMPSWSLIENGRQGSYKARTLGGVCRALGWSTDSIERLLAGEPPGLLEPPTRPQDDDELAELRARVQELEDQWEAVLRHAIAAGLADEADAVADSERRARQVQRVAPES